MGNTITYRLLENIDIERFEKEYKDILRRVVKGDSSIAQKEYTGLMAACDKLFKTESRERWKAYYMYLGIMQPVVENVVSGTSLEKEVNAFLRNVSTTQVKSMFELLEEDLARPEDSEEESQFEQYCVEIDTFPIVDFAFAYKEARFFLHKEVELEPNGFLGIMIQVLHVLGCFALEKKLGGLPSSVIMQDASMYETFFRSLKEEEKHISNESTVEYDTGTPDSASNSNVRKIDDATLRLIEQAQREHQNRTNYVDHSFGGKIKRFCKMWNAIITKFFGKKVVPLFWVALVILYLKDLLIGVVVTLILYFIGKFIKV